MKRVDTTQFTLSPVTITVTKGQEGDPETFRHRCCFDEAPTSGPTDPAMLLGLGQAMMALGKQIVDQALATSPGSPPGGPPPQAPPAAQN